MKRHLRIRKKVKGTAERPRLSVFRSSKHMYAQLIDDVAGATLVSASTLDAEYKENYGGNKEAAEAIGKMIAARAIDKGMPIEQVQKILGHSQIGTTMQYAIVNQNNVKTSHQKFIA